MKTLNKNLKARFTTENDNGQNNGQKMETISTYKVIDKKTEREIILIRVYMGRSRNAQTVKASVWVNGIKDNKRPSDWSQWGSTAGHGSAGGWGYCKKSTAVCNMCFPGWTSTSVKATSSRPKPPASSACPRRRFVDSSAKVPDGLFVAMSMN